MILEVLKYPDQRLREKSAEVKDFSKDLEKLSKNMLETMYSENGIGLAAPQVGELLRMLVIDCRPRDTKGRYKIEDVTPLEAAVPQPLIVINPVVVKSKGKTTYEEGCLSVPTFFDTVARAKWIELEYHDLKGQKKTIETDGLLAIVIQHEMDHLEGTLFIDHLSMIKANRIKNQIKKHGYPERKKAGEEEEELTTTGRNL